MTKEDKISKYVGEWYGWMLGEVKRNIAKDRMAEYAEDLLHHIVLDLYNLPAPKITQMVDEDKLRWYVLSGCGLQLRSSTSPFYRLHRRTKMEARENYTHSSEREYSDSFAGKGILEQIYEEYDDIIERLQGCFDREMKNLHWYQRHLMERYWIEKKTLTQLHKIYNIPKNHIIKDINEAMDIIRDKCKEC